MPEDTPAQQKAPNGTPLSRAQSVKLWVGVVAAVALVVACLAKGFSDGGNPEVDARIACQDWVKEQLKAPATADFSDIEISVDGDVYTVVGAVDAENSFGAKIRNHWTCETQDTGDTFTKLSVTVN
jgi:hypothetical protein